MIGPPSRLASTKCTVTPLSFTPCATACAEASTPGNAGNNDGCVLTSHFLDRFPLRIINTHPSLLPAFPGIDAPAQAIAHGVKLSGLSVHFVDASLDGGPIIAQVAVPVLPDDDTASLHARIQREEHRVLPEVVRRLAAGQLSCQGRLVRAE